MCVWERAEKWCFKCCHHGVFGVSVFKCVCLWRALCVSVNDLWVFVRAESMHRQFVQDDTTVLYVLFLSVVSKVFMCLLKSSCNVKKTSAVFKSWVWMCLKPQHIVKDIVTLRYLSDSCLCLVPKTYTG